MALGKTHLETSPVSFVTGNFPASFAVQSSFQADDSESPQRAETRKRSCAFLTPSGISACRGLSEASRASRVTGGGVDSDAQGKATLSVGWVWAALGQGYE